MELLMSNKNKAEFKKITDWGKQFGKVGQDILRDVENVGRRELSKRWKTLPPETTVKSTRTKTKVQLIASGTEVLFYEFGTGVKYSGIVHPEAYTLGYGPGSFPGKGLWAHPQGWWYEQREGRVPAGRIMETSKGTILGHTYGLPAYMPTYNVGQLLEDYLKKKVEGK